MEIEFIGHAGFRIDNVAIDPWLNKFKISKNPEAIILTHSHDDHKDGAIELANKHSIPVIGTPETIADADNQVGMNIGGPATRKDFEISFTQAFHTGNPTGVILKKNNTTIYHTGDTGLFSDMKLLGELHHPDIMMVCIGGNYTMDIHQALEAVEMVNPKTVIPMHYNTFPQIQADAQKFKELVETHTNAKVKVMQAGDTLKI